MEIDIFSKKGNVGGHDLTKICGKQDPVLTVTRTDIQISGD